MAQWSRVVLEGFQGGADFEVEQMTAAQDKTAPDQVAHIGTEIRLDGQPYRVTRTVPHTRADGATSHLLVWSAPCWECGAPFEVTTPVTGFSKTPSRRCRLHQRPGLKVQGTYIFKKDDPHMQNKNTPTTEWSLVGKFGHAFDDLGQVRNQFHIVGQPAPGHYAVQLFEWFFGEPTEIRIWPVQDLFACRLFDDRDLWCEHARVPR